ncbi:choice-of-anchor D domain-containing protein, partial [Candidatus Saccharibacteria bacterium]|nr:choice-of-anchor D domain-containing protein [Candidatus Saccharibacteria bacterium]
GVGFQNVQRDVTGTGSNPAVITITDGPTFDFGTVSVGSSSDHTFTLNNTGGVTAATVTGTGLAAPFTYKGGSYPGTGGTCGASIAAGANCTVVINYSPVGTGVHNDTVDINYHNGVSVTLSSRDVQGTATTPAVLTISETDPFDYGTQALSSTTDHSFTVGNTGGLQATSIAGSGLAAPFEFKGGSYPGLGGTCGATLNAASNCTIIVSFSPTASVTSNDTINIDYDDGAAPQQVTRDVTGTGGGNALLTISNGPTYDYGTKTVGSSTDFTFTVNNTGSVTATALAGSGLAAPFSFKGGSYPGIGGTCNTSLTASGSCSIVVTYAPLATGSHSDTILIDYVDGATGQQASRDVQGQGAGAATLVISDGPSYDYGTRAIGSNTDHTFTVDNTGGSPASSMAGTGLAAPFSYKGGSYPGTGGDCGATLASATSCNIVVTYSPSAAILSNDTIQIDYDDGAASQAATRDVAGTGVVAANLVVSDGPTFDFGTKATGSNTDHTFTVDNTGGAQATGMTGGVLTAPFAFKGGSYPGTGGTCSGSLNNGSQCTLVVTYSPVTVAVHTDTLSVNYNNGVAAAVANRDVQGTGANPATITISDGPTYNYGTLTVGGSSDHAFTLTNTGGVDATSIAASGLAAPYNYKDGSYPGTGGDCSNLLAPAGTCTIVITYSPTIAGTHNDTLQVDYQDGVTSQS